MAFPTAVNSQITDATQTTVNPQITDEATSGRAQATGSGAAVTMGNLFIATSQALSLAAQNATNNQQQSYTTMQASTAQAVSTLLTLDTAATGAATSTIFEKK